MQTEQSFETKVKKITASQIIMYMVEGLKNPVAKIDMDTFGVIKHSNKGYRVCFGCAATNTVCKIYDITHRDLLKLHGRTSRLNHSRESTFITEFEIAIDHLRTGRVWHYNSIANDFGFAKIKSTKKIRLSLKILESNFDVIELNEYIELAKYNRRLEKNKQLNSHKNEKSKLAIKKNHKLGNRNVHKK